MPVHEFFSGDTFAPTLARVTAAIEGAGLTIFARIDHATAAQDVGMAMPPTIVLVYGNPRGGTPIMLANPQAALDLPLRVLIREDAEGRVVIAFHPIVQLMQDAGVAEDLAMRLEAAQALLSKGIKP